MKTNKLQQTAIMPIDIDEFQVDLTHELGRGAFGTVYLCHDNNTVKFAGKKLSQPTPKILENLELLEQLGSQKSDHCGDQSVLFIRKIVQTQDNNVWIFMPFCELGNLNDYCDNSYSDISDVTKFSFMRQITSGLLFLHVRKIVHRDIKPANILVSNSVPGNSPVLKLCDFDLSKFIGPDEASMMSSNVGTAAFMAPEFWGMVMGEHLEYTKNVDIFASGLVFLSMLQAHPDSTLKPTLEDESASDEEKGQYIGLAMQIRKENLQQPFITAVQKLQDNIYVRRIKELICRMTHVDSLQRPETDEVHEAVKLHHQHLTNSDESCGSRKELHVGQRITKISCRDLNTIHVTEQGDVAVSAADAVRMYTLQGELKHEWKASINEPTGMTSLKINNLDYIAISMVISETSKEPADSMVKVPTIDRVQIQIRNKADRTSEAIPWGPAAYSVFGECGLGRNLALLKSGRLILAVKPSDEEPCVVHLLNCSEIKFECLMQIRTDSLHPPAICALTLDVGDVVVVADVWNSDEQCSVTAYDEQTGEIKWQIKEESLKKASKREKFTLASICATSQHKILVSEGTDNVIFEATVSEKEVEIREVMNCWDHEVWSPSCMAWHALSHCVVVIHKDDNRFGSITDGEYFLSVYTTC